MYRVISFVTALLLNISVYATCYNSDDLTLNLTIESKSKYLLELRDGSFGNYYFCLDRDEKNNLICQGDDDAGEFYFNENELVLKSKLSFGSPEEPFFIKMVENKKFSKVQCSK